MPAQPTSLRTRLALAFLMWTALLAVPVGIGIPLIRNWYLGVTLDSIVSRELAPDLRRIARASPTPADFLAAAEPVLAQAHEHVVLAVDAAPAARPVAAALQQAHAAGRGIAVSDEVAADGESRSIRWHIVPLTVTLADGAPLDLLAGVSLLRADQQSRLLLTLLYATLLAGVLATAVAGWFVAARLVGRIEHLAAALRNLSPGELQSSRIAVPGGDDELGRMVHDLNAMLLRLDVAFRSHERFIQHVSHELKTPVAALLTEAQVLKYMNPSAEAYRAFVLSVEDEMRRLGKLVESFLILARFGHGRRYVAETVVSINDAALESMQHSSMLSQQRHVPVNLTLHDPGDSGDDPIVRGDAELLRVAIDNLIRNAIQFSKAGDPVDVDIAADPATVLITVRDRGPGIPPGWNERIFERFTQVPGGDPGRRGTGLGLTITKGIVDIHGGTIEVRNHPHGGCQFAIRLPRDLPGAVGGHPPGHPAPAPGRAPEPIPHPASAVSA